MRKPDAVLNLYEGTLDDAETETYIAGLLSWSGIPIPGARRRTLSLARAKHLTKLLLKGAGLPTADFMVIAEEPVPECRLRWPVIVKPAAQDASVGIEHASVCQNQADMDGPRPPRAANLWKARFWSRSSFLAAKSSSAVTALPELRALPAAEDSFRVRPAYLADSDLQQQMAARLRRLRHHAARISRRPRARTRRQLAQTAKRGLPRARLPRLCRGSIFA